MGANGATKCLRVVKNLENILAIELLTATQALDLRRPLKSSVVIEETFLAYRKLVSFNDADRILADDIKKSVSFMQNFDA